MKNLWVVIDSRLADSEALAKWQELLEITKNRTDSNVPEEYLRKLEESQDAANDWYEWQREKIAVKTKREKIWISREAWDYIDEILAKKLWVSPENKTIMLVNNQLEELGLQAIHPANDNELEKVA